jgi:predicted DNA-binding ribbon-helix-helix protein
MIRTQIQLTDEQVRRLKTLATERGVSVAELIRQAVDRHVAAGVTASARRERAISGIGGFRSGLTDVSERHDEHLASAYHQ